MRPPGAGSIGPSAPRVSVLLPYRDAASTIAEAIDSILRQRDVSLELVAIDDGSADASAARVRERARTDARVVTIDGEARGIASALVTGLAVASAPLIARMDADDVSDPDRLATQVALLEARPDIDLCATRVEPFATPPESVGDGMRRYCDWQNGLLSPEDHRLARFIESPVCHPSVVVRRTAIAIFGTWREGAFPEDYELWLRMLAGGARFAKTERVLHRWRVHHGQTTFRDPRYSAESIRALRARWVAEELAKRDRPIVVWGAGPTGTRLARALEAHGIRPRAFVDIDPRKVGSTRRGVPVVAPETLVRAADVIVVCVGAAGARDVISTWLIDRGFENGGDFLCAA